MFLVRFFAGLALLVAILALTSDVTRAMNGAGVAATSLATHWKALSPLGLASAQQAISRAAHPMVWDQILARLLALPSFLVFGSIGLTLAWFGRRRRRVNIFAN